MKFYIIGDKEIVLAFRLTGIEGEIAMTRESVLDAFLRVTGQSKTSVVGDVARVLILTERAGALITEEVLAWQKKGNFPLIVEIPSLDGHLEGRQSLSASIREAVGVQV